MEIVKKNILSILCGVVALICVTLVFYPFNGMYALLEKHVDERAKVGESLVKVRNEARAWPSLSPNEADHVPLKHFPTQLTLDLGSKQTQSWTQESIDFLGRAVQYQIKLVAPENQLEPGALPGVPGQQYTAFNFLDKYKIIFGMNGPAGKGVQFPPEGALKVLKGGMPPTELEIQTRLDEAIAEIKNSVPRVVDGKVQNQPEVDAAIEQAKKDVPELVRQDDASHYVVYFDPNTTFQPEPKLSINALVAPNVNDIFAAQVGLWVQQEFCRAIAETNGGAKNGVLDAPIKRLITMRLTLPYNPVPGQPVAGQEPLKVGAAPAGRVPMDFGHNPLGQTSNELYDVIPVQLSFICDAETVPATLTGLSRDRFIMVRNVELLSVDSAVAFAQGYVFGDKPVVQVNMRCQYLMLRNVLGPLMPQDIIRGLTTPAPPG